MAAVAAVMPAAAVMAQQPPTLPTIGSAYDNVTVSNSNVDGGSIAVGNGSTSSATLNTTVINDAISYVSSQGGGTVEVPASAGAYISNELFLKNNVDLEVDTGATLQDNTPTASFITTTGTTHDIEISGGGAINGNATTTSSNNLVPLNNVTDLEVTNITIENSSHEHLVPEDDTNVTINGVTIADPLVAASGYLANTDGIDYSGSNFLIENCNVNDGDDDIVAKPGTNSASSNIVINMCTIGAGHGISIGGQTNGGLNGMLVENITMNGTDNGVRLKAGDPSGGLVQNVTFIHMTMTNVVHALIIDSYYANGQSNYPTSTPFPAASDADGLQPYWDNIAFEDITATGQSNSMQIYGLNISPANINNLLLKNISMSSTGQDYDIFYADNVDIQNVTGPGFDEYADTFVTPEPGSILLTGVAGLLGLSRRRRARRARTGADTDFRGLLCTSPGRLPRPPGD